MQMLAHRGIWSQPDEKNSLHAILAAFEQSVGIETDIRDCDGSLVISHDPPLSANALLLDDVLQSYMAHIDRPVLALNIKSDGLQVPLAAALHSHGVENYFVFDMSIPDTIGYQRAQMPFASRISEYEPETELSQNAHWIWLDAFNDDWFALDSIKKWLSQGKNVAIVSPELHLRPHLPLWQQLMVFSNHPKVYLCTDFVAEAKEFFNAEKN